MAATYFTIVIIDNFSGDSIQKKQFSEIKNSTILNLVFLLILKTALIKIFINLPVAIRH